MIVCLTPAIVYFIQGKLDVSLGLSFPRLWMYKGHIVTVTVTVRRPTHRKERRWMRYLQADLVVT